MMTSRRRFLSLLAILPVAKILPQEKSLEAGFIPRRAPAGLIRGDKSIVGYKGRTLRDVGFYYTTYIPLQYMDESKRIPLSELPVLKNMRRSGS